MKVYIQCKSALLQRSLEMFLESNLSTYKQSDIVLRDFIKDDESKPHFYIASSEDADIKKPFTRSYLLQFLEKKYAELGMSSTLESIEAIEEDTSELNTKTEVTYSTPENFDILEKRIELLTLEYQKNIINAVKAFYEK